MKTNIYKKFSLLFMTLLMLLSCEDFEEMNRNPTTSTDMDPNLMLPTIQMQLSGGQFEQWRNGFIYSGDWMQHWTGEYASTEFGSKGQKNDAYMGALWETQFPREVKNIVDMVARTTNDPSRTNINAVSKIMKVYIFSRLTDCLKLLILRSGIDHSVWGMLIVVAMSEFRHCTLSDFS